MSERYELPEVVLTEYMTRNLSDVALKWTNHEPEKGLWLTIADDQ